MSVSKIRRLYNAELITKLRTPEGKLKWPTVFNGMQLPSNSDAYLVAHIVPSPTASDTLSGDHTCYTGIYQITVRVTGTVDDEFVVDMNDQMDEIIDYLADSFKINTRLIGTSGFVVQQVSPLKVSEAHKNPNDQWWEAYAYFNYRADTN